MKNLILLAFCLCIFIFSSASITAQQNDSVPVISKKKVTLRVDKSKVKVQRHTVMSRFDSDIASSEQERLEKRNERIAATERRISILDTLDISERKRKMLLRDLKYTPYSSRLNKAVIVETKIEEEEEESSNKN